MSFVYNKIWDVISKKQMSKEELRNQIGASQTTIVKMGRNENVSLDIIDRICTVLNCVPNDIIEYKNDSNTYEVCNVRDEDINNLQFAIEILQQTILKANKL